MGENDLSYCELRSKEVVNATDGKRMGRIVDLTFSGESGKVTGIIVPFGKRSVFGKNQDVFIPWRCVCKIGEDVILVNLISDPSGRLTCAEDKNPPPKPPCDDRHCSSKGDCAPAPKKHASGDVPYPDCDFRCEKCMLFDCAYRWTQTN